jgi:hypothetical protein
MPVVPIRIEQQRGGLGRGVIARQMSTKSVPFAGVDGGSDYMVSGGVKDRLLHVGLTELARSADAIKAVSAA